MLDALTLSSHAAIMENASGNTAPEVIVVGGGPLALLTALLLHKQGIAVTITGELPPTNPPLNPELMLIGGDDILPGLFQTSLQQWRSLSSRIGIPPLIHTMPSQDLATSEGRVTKLREEALYDALGGETVTYQNTPSEFSPMSLGSKSWQETPVLVPSTQQILQQAVVAAGIPRLMLNPAALSIVNLTDPHLTMEDGSTMHARHIIFTSARALRRVLPPLGLALPLRPARGHVIMLQTSSPHGLPLLLQRLHRGHLFIVPVTANRIDIHYDAINDPAQSTFTTRHSANLVTALMQHASQLAPALEGATMLGVTTSRHWLTPDFFPALGPWPGLPGVLVGSGWGGRRTALAAGAAHILVEAVTTGTAGLDIHALAPNRFANGLWQVVKQPGSLTWQEPNIVKAANLMSPKPDYAINVNLTEAPKAQYANNVQQISKNITESAARRPTVTQTRSKPKIQTASVKSS